MPLRLFEVHKINIFQKTLRLLDKERKNIHQKADFQAISVSFKQHKKELARLAMAEKDLKKNEAYDQECTLLDTLIIKAKERLEGL